MKTKTLQTLLRVLDFASSALLVTFAAMFAFLAIVAFISMFTDSFIFGLFGTVGASFCAWACWSVR